MNKEKRIITKRIKDCAGGAGFISQFGTVYPASQAD